MGLFKLNEHIVDVKLGEIDISYINLGNSRVWPSTMYYTRYIDSLEDLYIFTNYTQVSSEGSLIRDINLQGVIAKSSFPKYSPTKVGNYYFTEIKWDLTKGLECINATTKTTTYIFSGNVALAYMKDNKFYFLKTISVQNCLKLEILNLRSGRGIIHLGEFANAVCFSTKSGLTTLPSGLTLYRTSKLPAYYNKYFESYINFFDENNFKIWDGNSVVTYEGLNINDLYVYRYNSLDGSLIQLYLNSNNYWGTGVWVF